VAEVTELRLSWKPVFSSQISIWIYLIFFPKKTYSYLARRMLQTETIYLVFSNCHLRRKRYFW